MTHRCLALPIAALAAALAAPCVHATAQEPDLLILEGIEHALIGYPLEGLFEAEPERKPESTGISSSLWRGYKARWAIRDGGLYLQTLVVMHYEPDPDWDADRPEEGSPGEVSLVDVMRRVFPDRDPVIADWYSGHLIPATPELVAHANLGWVSALESHLVLTVEEGRIVAERRLDEAEFRVFRRAQFRSFEETDGYAEILAHAVAQGLSPKEAREHHFRALVVRYLPLSRPERPRDFVDRMILNQGLWTGRRITSRAGNCAMKNARADVSIELRVDELGTLSGWYAAPKPDREAPFFTGTVSPDGTVRATTSADAFCAGSKRQNESVWTGAVRAKKKGLELEFKGRSDPCPEMGCKFKVRYRLEAPER